MYQSLNRKVFGRLQFNSDPPIRTHSLFNLFACTFITLIGNKNEKFIARNYCSKINAICIFLFFMFLKLLSSLCKQAHPFFCCKCIQVKVVSQDVCLVWYILWALNTVKKSLKIKTYTSLNAGTKMIFTRNIFFITN